MEKTDQQDKPNTHPSNAIYLRYAKLERKRIQKEESLKRMLVNQVEMPKPSFVKQTSYFDSEEVETSELNSLVLTQQEAKILEAFTSKLKMFDKKPEQQITDSRGRHKISEGKISTRPTPKRRDNYHQAGLRGVISTLAPQFYENPKQPVAPMETLQLLNKNQRSKPELIDVSANSNQKMSSGTSSSNSNVFINVKSTVSVDMPLNDSNSMMLESPLMTQNDEKEKDIIQPDVQAKFMGPPLDSKQSAVGVGYIQSKQQLDNLMQSDSQRQAQKDTDRMKLLKQSFF